MKLHELKKNEGATFARKRVGHGPGSDLEKLLEKVIKDKKLEVEHQLIQYSKVDKLHFTEDYIKEDLLMHNLKLDMQQLM